MPSSQSTFDFIAPSAERLIVLGLADNPPPALVPVTRYGPDDPRLNIYTIVDKPLLDHVNGEKAWELVRPRGKQYATRRVRREQRRGGDYLHRIVVTTVLGHPIPEGMHVHHKNGNGLDNRAQNLELVTPTENKYHLRREGGTSKYMGVCWNRRRRAWISYANHDGDRTYFGYFNTEIEAAIARDDGLVARRGPFACLNFPERYPSFQPVVPMDIPLIYPHHDDQGYWPYDEIPPVSYDEALRIATTARMTQEFWAENDGDLAEPFVSDAGSLGEEEIPF